MKDNGKELTTKATWVLDLVGGEHQASASLTPGKPRYPLYNMLHGPQGRSEGLRKIAPHTGFRSPDRSARSESLYRLRYPGPQI